MCPRQPKGVLDHVVKWPMRFKMLRQVFLGSPFRPRTKLSDKLWYHVHSYLFIFCVRFMARQEKYVRTLPHVLFFFVCDSRLQDARAKTRAKKHRAHRIDIRSLYRLRRASATLRNGGVFPELLFFSGPSFSLCAPVPGAEKANRPRFSSMSSTFNPFGTWLAWL